MCAKQKKSRNIGQFGHLELLQLYFTSNPPVAGKIGKQGHNARIMASLAVESKIIIGAQEIQKDQQDTWPRGHLSCENWRISHILQINAIQAKLCKILLQIHSFHVYGGLLAKMATTWTNKNIPFFTRICQNWTNKNVSFFEKMFLFFRKCFFFSKKSSKIYKNLPFFLRNVAKFAENVAFLGKIWPFWAFFTHFSLIMPLKAGILGKRAGPQGHRAGPQLLKAGPQGLTRGKTSFIYAHAAAIFIIGAQENIRLNEDKINIFLYTHTHSRVFYYWGLGIIEQLRQVEE